MFSKMKVQSKSDLQLAQEALNRSKSNVISSHDIISQMELLDIYADKIPQYINQFGIRKLKELLEYLQALEEVRKASSILIKKNQFQFSSLVQTVAISYCGYGQCHELRNRLFLELCLSNFTSP